MKGVNEAQWRAKASIFSTMSEDRLGKRLSADGLKPGDMVSVATRLGRTLGSGEVVSSDEGIVTLRLSSSYQKNGSEQTQSFPKEIYVFYKYDKDESDNLAEGGSVQDPDQSASTGELPAKPDDAPPDEATGIVMAEVGTGLRHATTILSDIGSYGYRRAMSRHGIPATMAARMGTRLVSVGYISARDMLGMFSGEPGEEEWATAVHR